MMSGAEADNLWTRVREFTPDYLAENPFAVVLRISCALSEVESQLATLETPAVWRAGTGAGCAYFPNWSDAQEWMEESRAKVVVEHAPAEVREYSTLWPEPGSDFAMMERIKDMFDPRRLLNKGRLYGRI